ncbi:MAG TPA: hydroxyisourate hydrolase [Acidisarcina sp.]
MSGISTHILDLALGCPAAGVGVKLLLWKNKSWVEIAAQRTDIDGRCRELLPLSEMSASIYRIVIDSGGYFGVSREPGLYPDISITFDVRDATTGYHMPLLLSPNGYTTYRGS